MRRVIRACVAWGLLGACSRVIDAPLPVDVALGSGRAFVLLSDGTVRGAGDNREGRVTPDRPERRLDAAVPVVGLAGIVQVVTLDGTNCARRYDGAVFCWGSNEDGRLGDGATSPRNEVVRVAGIADATCIAGVGRRVCACRADGSLWCWGTACPARADGTNGCSAGAEPSGPRPLVDPLLDGVVQVVPGGASGVFARTRDGRVLWGEDRWRGVDVPRAVALAAGAGHVCALLEDRTVWCWGDDAYGQLGSGRASHRCLDCPPRVGPDDRRFDPGLQDVVQVVAGSFHTCALLADRTVWCWGLDADGMLGAGNGSTAACRDDRRCRPRPARVLDLDDVARVVAGELVTCAIRRDDSLWCWGSRAILGNLVTPPDAVARIVSRPAPVRWR